MVRPKKKYKVFDNGSSIQCFIDSDYVGSISKKKLCENLYVLKAKLTTDD